MTVAIDLVRVADVAATIARFRDPDTRHGYTAAEIAYRAAAPRVRAEPRI